jgi:hypothetical protein
MKVALLLPGQIREASDTYPYIKGRIIDRFNSDVFISTWNPSDSINGSLHAETQHLTDTLSIDTLAKLYSTRSLKTDDFGSDGINSLIERAWSYEKFGPQTGEINPVSVFLMWYKIKQSFLLMEEYENLLGERYDYVIKGRMDIKIHNHIPLDPNLNTICIPPGYDWKGGVNDIFAWGGRDSMEHYCKMFDFMEEYILSGIYFHPETLLRHHIASSEYNLTRPLVKVSLRGKKVWETEVIGEEIFKKSYGYIESKGNFWST